MCVDCLPRPGRTVTRPASAAALRLTPPVSVTDGLEIFPRSAWAGEDRPALGELYPEQVQFLLVHHTAGKSDYSEDGAIAEMQGVYSFHTGPDKGWPDVCYNFFVDRFGRVFEARTGSLAGPVMADATGGNQGFAQLVCLLGDFTDSMPSPEAVDALTRTLTWLAGRHRLSIGADATTMFASRGSNLWPEGSEVTTNTIAGHRDMSQTACPGDAFYPFVTTTLRTDVQQRLAVAPPVPGAAPGGSTAATQPGAGSMAPSTAAAGTPSDSAIATPPPTAQASAAPGVTTVASGPAASTVEIGGDRSGASDIARGGVVGVGVVGLAAGLGWVIKRRMENEGHNES